MKSDLIPLLIGALAFPAPAHARAEGTACANPTAIVPDGRMTSSSVPATTTFYFLISSRVGSSYSAEFHNVLGAAVQLPGTLTLYSDSGCTVPITPTDTSGVDPGDQNGARVSFTATTTVTRFALNNISGSPVTYSFAVSDTTMFSPAWSTNGTYDTFYSFLNTTNATITGTVTLYNTPGTQVSTSSLTIGPNSTASTNTAALGTTRNAAGTARFAHNGPPGAILAEAAVGNFTLAIPYIQSVKFMPVRSGDAAALGGVAAGAVGTAQLADGSVTGAKIAPGAVVKSLNAQADAVTLAGTNGLSVSQGGGTVTVTSNATPNFSTDTIVARDGSGNFYTNSISAALLGATNVYSTLVNVDFFGQNQGTVSAASLLFGAGGTGEGIASKRDGGGNQFGLDFYTQFARRMALTQSGNAVLDPQGTNAGDLTSGSVLFGQLDSGEGIASKRTATGNQFGLDFYTNHVRRMALTQSGNAIIDADGVNVGDTSTGALLFGGMLSGEGIGSKRTLGGNNQLGLDFYTFYTQRMYITQGGLVFRGDNLATFNQVSDGRLKNVKSGFDRGLKEILGLTPVRYEYKPGNPLSLPGGEHVGVVAQEVQGLIPEAVTRDERGYLGLTLDPVFWTMINAVKEQEAELEALRGKVRSLSTASTRAEAENADLRARLAQLEGAVRVLARRNEASEHQIAER